MRDLHRIRRHLDLSTATSLANALVSSRLDYCNSLLYGISDHNLRKLQTVQNTLCRIVTRTSRFSHITPKLKELHWLPIKQRIIFKINLLSFKAINFGSPPYINETFKPITSKYDTRQTDPELKYMHVPLFDNSKFKYKKIFNNTFSHVAPLLWNNLPDKIRTATSLLSFRKYLKTHLYNDAFPP